MPDTPVTARELMSWQESLANSAHQREIADLKAAGLNPVLSAKFGGAQVPSGAMDPNVGSVPGSGSGSGSGNLSLSSQGDSFFDGLVNSLPDKGSIRIFGVPIPYSVIKYIYQYAGGTEGILNYVNGLTGGNFSLEDVANGLLGKGDDNPGSAVAITDSKIESSAPAYDRGPHSPKARQREADFRFLDEVDWPALNEFLHSGKAVKRAYAKVK